VVTILSWDGAPPPRFQRLVETSVEALAAGYGRPLRFRVWIERRQEKPPGRARRSLHHVRLDVEMASPERLAGWQMRAESTGPSVEQSFRAALRAVNTFARGVQSVSMVQAVRPD
jgi:hypothetical protein